MSLELSLFIVLLCTAFVPVLVRLWGITVRGNTAVIGLISLWLGLTGAIVWAALQTDYQSPDSAKNRPRELPTDQYVGSDTCRSCHPHHHATWHDSYHRSMTQIATPKSVIGDFSGERLVDGEVQALFEREGERFMVDITLQKQGHMGRFPIVMTTGSHHMQVYWFAPTDTSRHLALAPFIYLKTEQQWVPRRSIFLNHPFEERPEIMSLNSDVGLWSKLCIKCHTTHGRQRPQFVGGTQKIKSLDTQAVEFGISCESCHGPGREHVRVNRSPLHRYRNHLSDQPDATMVNPANLSHVLSSQVCGQCHSVYKFLDVEGAKRWSVHGFDYRPGGDLSKSRMRYVVQPGSRLTSQIVKRSPRSQDFEHYFWSDGMIRVSGREYNGLIESPCFQSEDADRAKMSCLSCHQMHQADSDARTRQEWANDQLKHDVQGNAACVQCHGQFEEADAITAHTHHTVGSSGSLCYNCHMPHTTYGLLKAIRSHQVDSPSVQASLETGRPNACNQCHLDKTLGWTAEHLSDWHGIAKPKLSQDENEIAASVLWLLRGDAGQRALMAWSYGWKDARQTSGTHWQAPYLAQLLDDPYDTVRFIAHRSLRRLPGFADFRYEFMGPPGDRVAARRRALSIWEDSPQPTHAADDRRVLLDEQGHVMQQAFDRLFKARDDRRMNLLE